MDIFLFSKWRPSAILNLVTGHCALSRSTIMPNLVTIAQTVAELLHFSVFQNGGRRHLGFGWILFSGHPRSLNDDLKLRLKFYVDLYFRRYCDFNFWKFGLKCLFRPKNWGFWGISTPKHFGLSSRPQKALPCAEPRILTYRSSKSVNRGDLQAR